MLKIENGTISSVPRHLPPITTGTPTRTAPKNNLSPPENLPNIERLSLRNFFTTIRFCTIFILQKIKIQKNIVLAFKIIFRGINFKENLDCFFGHPLILQKTLITIGPF